MSPKLWLQAVLTVVYCTMGMFVDLVSAMNMLGLLSQFKVTMVLFALIYTKHKRKDLQGTIKVSLNP